VQQVAQELGIKLTQRSAYLVAESVGNNTRQLYSELENCFFVHNKHLDVDSVAQLVQANTQNSLHLAAAIE